LVTIVDYGMGNLASVQKALAKLGYASRLVSTSAEVQDAERLILPGVGAFGAAITNLLQADLVEPLRAYCASGRPFLGICLGMQLLMSSSEELGHWDGLGVIPGRVVRFFENSQAPAEIKIPHMGWNTLDMCKPGGILTDTPGGVSVYFVHSYYVVPEDSSVVAAECTHGETFCASIASGNVYATQFHPEKSGAVGLSMLKRFCELPA